MLVSAANRPSQIKSSRWFTIVRKTWNTQISNSLATSGCNWVATKHLGYSHKIVLRLIFGDTLFLTSFHWLLATCFNSQRQRGNIQNVPSPGKIRGREFPKAQRWNTTCQVIELLMSNVRSWGNVDICWRSYGISKINAYIYIPHIHCLLTKNTSILDLYPFPNIYCIFISLKSGVSSGNKTHQWHSITPIGS